MIKNIVKRIFLPLIFIVIIFFYFFYEKEKKIKKSEIIEKNYHSNIIKGVFYESKDAKGNKYIINAEKGEIDINNSNVIFLTNVNGLIDMVQSDDIKITSLYGRYNINNYDTIFSKNVVITYLENKIISDYADFSIARNSMIISKKVVYSNSENVLKADTIKMNIVSKDTKIYMHEADKKVKIIGLK